MITKLCFVSEGHTCVLKKEDASVLVCQSSKTINLKQLRTATRVGRIIYLLRGSYAQLGENR